MGQRDYKDQGWSNDQEILRDSVFQILQIHLDADVLVREHA